MNLKQYFDQHKDLYLSEDDKLSVYQKVITKQVQKSFAKRKSLLHIRSFAYSLIIVCLLVGIYGVYFLNSVQQNPGGGFFVQKQNSFGVQADYIAKVVDFNGNFYIEHDGKRLQTSTIQNNDTVILTPQTQMVFTISTGTQAKIIGPAKFVLTQVATSNEYQIELVYGDFIQMKSQDNTNQRVNLAVNGLSLRPSAGSQGVNFQMIKQGDQHIVKNYGSQLVISKIDGNETHLETKQVATIQKNDITLFDSIEAFAKAAKAKNISQTFVFTDDNTISVLESVDSFTDLNLLASREVVEDIVDTGVDASLGLLIDDDKKVPSPDQNKQLRALLYKSFVMSDIENVFVSFVGGKDKSLDIAFKNIENRISQLYQSFGIVGFSVGGGTPAAKFASLRQATTSLAEKIKTTYLVPDKYFDNLYTIAAWLDYLGSYQYNSMTGDDQAQSKRNNIKQGLPNNLQLK